VVDVATMFHTSHSFVNRRQPFTGGNLTGTVEGHSVKAIPGKENKKLSGHPSETVEQVFKKMFHISRSPANRQRPFAPKKPAKTISSQKRGTNKIFSKLKS